MIKLIFQSFFLILFVSLFSSCSINRVSNNNVIKRSTGRLPEESFSHPLVIQNNDRILKETKGNYYIGRRWWTKNTRFWGYLREPGSKNGWASAIAVIMNESKLKQPDRLQEFGVGKSHGYDNNYEYKIWGNFTGNRVYDPNLNLQVKEFILSKYELINSNPGFLFWPGEKNDGMKFPPLY